MILQREQPEPLVYWFSEGFTDFFARRLQLRYGFIEPEDYVKSLNDSLRRFHTSPVREASNTRILEEFWTDSNISELPYRRGDLVAMMLDHAILLAAAYFRRDLAFVTAADPRHGLGTGGSWLEWSREALITGCCGDPDALRARRLSRPEPPLRQPEGGTRSTHVKLAGNQSQPR